MEKIKRKDFIEKLNHLGYAVEKNYKKIYVKASEDDVVGSAIGKISERIEGVTQINSPEDLELVQLIAQYAATPLGDREEEKKYIYRFPLHVEDVGEVYIKNNPAYGLCLSGLRMDLPPKQYDSRYSFFHFTDAEVESYPEDIQALFKACEKEEVECE